MQEELDYSRLDPILKKYRGQEGALIPILQEAQAIYGYLPEEVLKTISQGLKIPLSRVYGVVTFYAQFYTTNGAGIRCGFAGGRPATCAGVRVF